MRRIMIIASLAALGACSKPAEVAPAATEAAAAADTVVVAAPGDYDVTGPDGTKHITTLAGDGTYTETDPAGKVTMKGTWATKEGKTCFVPEGTAEQCYTESAAAADGSFTATDDKGAITQVKPLAK